MCYSYSHRQCHLSFVFSLASVSFFSMFSVVLSVPAFPRFSSFFPFFLFLVLRKLSAGAFQSVVFVKLESLADFY